MKQSKQITIHVDDDFYSAIVVLATMHDKSLSEWCKSSLWCDVETTYLQAKNTASRLSMLENHEFLENSEKGGNQ